MQIIDLFHAIEHLWTVTKAIYGPGTGLVAQWVNQRQLELGNGQIDAILSALKIHASTSQQVALFIVYLQNNRQRMQCLTFRAMGLCVSSGVVEIGCKDTISTRLKRAGTHWSVDGANAIIALRCCILSNRFDDFWERRATLN